VFTVNLLSRAELELFQDQILAVYRRAFNIPSGPEGDQAIAHFKVNALERHAARPGFRCCVAVQASAVVGLAYGYSGGPGMWWYDHVTPAMTPQMIREWLSDYFEFVEFAVNPDAQRTGVGAKIHAVTLEGLPHRTAALSVAASNDSAIRFYRKHGWTPILEDFRGFGPPYMIMGKTLREP
jgi:ribosomal protein S18 acetylase RimI-like enzyme